MSSTADGLLVEPVVLHSIFGLSLSQWIRIVIERSDTHHRMHDEGPAVTADNHEA